MSAICCNNMQGLYDKHLNENPKKQAEENVLLEITHKMTMMTMELMLTCKCYISTEGKEPQQRAITSKLGCKRVSNAQVYLINFLLALKLFLHTKFFP